jgi:uncharacterized protein with PIN domain
VITVADTSAIIAASDRNARESTACRAVLQEAGTVIISPLVLTEVDHLAKVRFGSKARTAIIDFVLAQAGQSRFQIPETGLEVLDTAHMVQRQYAGLETSARCVPSPRTNGSGCSPTTYSRPPRHPACRAAAAGSAGEVIPGQHDHPGSVVRLSQRS